MRSDVSPDYNAHTALSFGCAAAGGTQMRAASAADAANSAAPGMERDAVELSSDAASPEAENELKPEGRTSVVGE